MITIGQMVEWILANRGEKVFRGWTVPEIVAALETGVNDNTLVYAVTPDNKIVGMVLAVKFYKEKVLFVVENLAMNMSNLRVFAKIAKERFPDWKLEFMKHDKHKKPDTIKLYNKLTH